MKVAKIFTYTVDYVGNQQSHTESDSYAFKQLLNAVGLIEAIELIRIGIRANEDGSEYPTRFGVITEDGEEIRTPKGADDIALIREVLIREGGEA